MRAVWQRLDEVWNARDADGFRALFTADALFAFMDSGERMEGDSAIHARFTRQFGAMAADLRHVTRLRAVRRIAQGVCTVDGDVVVMRGEAQEAQEAVVFRSFTMAAVMLNTATGWRIRELHVHQRPQQ